VLFIENPRMSSVISQLLGYFIKLILVGIQFIE